MLASCSKRCSSLIYPSVRSPRLRTGFATTADESSGSEDTISPQILMQTLTPGTQSNNPFRRRAQNETSSPNAKTPNGMEGEKIDTSTVTNMPFRLSANCGSNNAIFTLRSMNDKKTYAQVSGGMCKFKNAARGSYEAGYQCAIRMFAAIAKAQKDNSSKDVEVEIRLNGRGMAREALLKALTTSEGDAIRKSIVRLTDVTPIKIGGARAKKAKRL